MKRRRVVENADKHLNYTSFWLFCDIQENGYLTNTVVTPITFVVV